MYFSTVKKLKSFWNLAEYNSGLHYFHENATIQLRESFYQISLLLNNTWQY